MGAHDEHLSGCVDDFARVMTINNLNTITPDAVEAAREVLVVGV